MQQRRWGQVSQGDGGESSGCHRVSISRRRGCGSSFTHFPAAVEVVLRCGYMEITGDLDTSESSST